MLIYLHQRRLQIKDHTEESGGIQSKKINKRNLKELENVSSSDITIPNLCCDSEPCIILYRLSCALSLHLSGFVCLLVTLHIHAFNNPHSLRYESCWVFFNCLRDVRVRSLIKSSIFCCLCSLTLASRLCLTGITMLRKVTQM